jgi:hypothetical protein
VPTLSMKRGFIGVAKNQPMTGSITSGRFTCGRQRKTVAATSRNVSSLTFT